MSMEHGERKRWCEEISKINQQRSREESNNTISSLDENFLKKPR